ncbi:MAG: deoxyribonuclease IV [Elusimicrobia bacterium]|nr:deoxyribonuclease IV [Elusimicrobiota bacterium]
MTKKLSNLSKPLLGAHMSIAGGVDKAILAGDSIHCEAIQIFTKSSRQWKASPYSKEEISNFKSYKSKSSIKIVIAHDSYLLNLGSPNDFLRSRSVQAMIDEMERCETLEIPYLIAHPGSHTGAGEKEGIKLIAKSLNEVLDAAKGFNAQITLEITAGQGTNLGYSFDQIGAIIQETKLSDRIQVCFDTEHAFAAGYDIRTPDGYERTFKEFDEKIGLKKLAAFHLNDSKKELGSKVDRHEHIGKGFLGKEPFNLLLNDPRFSGKPMCLETPKGPDLKEDVENLKILKDLFPNP